MKEKHNLTQITKTLEKIFNAGFNTEKKILAMKMEDLEKIPNLLSNEALIIIDLKKAIKSKTLIAFFSGEKNQTSPQKSNITNYQNTMINRNN